MCLPWEAYEILKSKKKNISTYITVTHNLKQQYCEILMNCFLFCMDFKM